MGPVSETESPLSGNSDHVSGLTLIRPVSRMNPPFAGVTAVNTSLEVKIKHVYDRASDVFLP